MTTGVFLLLCLGMTAVLAAAAWQLAHYAHSVEILERENERLNQSVYDLLEMMTDHLPPDQELAGDSQGHIHVVKAHGFIFDDDEEDEDEYA